MIPGGGGADGGLADGEPWRRRAAHYADGADRVDREEVSCAGRARGVTLVPRRRGGGAILTKCGPSPPRRKIPWRRG
jgi:hypothetical protein